MSDQIEITLNDQNFRRAIAGVEEYLRGSRQVMIIIGRSLANYTRETIVSGGRGNWPPLSRWTRRRTGRSLPLRGTSNLIAYEADAQHARVFARPTGQDWSLDMHARGYYTPARVPANAKAMRIPMASGKPVFLKSARPSIVPPRPFIPSHEEAVEIARPAVAEWVAEGMRRVWH